MSKTCMLNRVIETQGMHLHHIVMIIINNTSWIIPQQLDQLTQEIKLIDEDMLKVKVALHHIYMIIHFLCVNVTVIFTSFF